MEHILFVCGWCHRRPIKDQCVSLVPPSEYIIVSGICTCYFHASCTEQMRYDIDGVREGFPAREVVPTDCIRDLARALNQSVYYCNTCKAMGSSLVSVLPSACICCARRDTEPDAEVICTHCCNILVEYIYTKVSPVYELTFDLPSLVRDGAQDRLLVDLRLVPKIGQQLIVQCVVNYMLAHRHAIQNVLLVVAHSSVQVRTLECVLATFWVDLLLNSGVAEINLGTYMATHGPQQIVALARGNELVYRAAVDRIWATVIAGSHARLAVAGPRLRISSPYTQRVVRIKRGLPYDKPSLWLYLQQQTPFIGRRVMDLLPFYCTVYEDLQALAQAQLLVIVPLTNKCEEIVYVRVPVQATFSPLLLQHWRAVTRV